MRDVIKSITDRIHDTASVKNVYGDPIVAQGKTIIPVARVKYGFGGGGGQEGEPSNPENDGQASRGRMGGGGGGGGVKPPPLLLPPQAPIRADNVNMAMVERIILFMISPTPRARSQIRL